VDWLLHQHGDPSLYFHLYIKITPKDACASPVRRGLVTRVKITVANKNHLIHVERKGEELTNEGAQPPSVST
jgi:hypothetical protein